MKRKIFAVILSIALFISMFDSSLVAQAEDTVSGAAVEKQSDDKEEKTVESGSLSTENIEKENLKKNSVDNSGAIASESEKKKQCCKKYL